jgi:hypothetical protein
MVYSHFLCSFLKQVIIMNTRESTGGIAHSGIPGTLRTKGSGFKPSGMQVRNSCQPALSLTLGDFCPPSCQVGSAVVCFKRKKEKEKKKENHHHHWIDGTFFPWMNIISLVHTSGVHLWNWTLVGLGSTRWNMATPVHTSGLLVHSKVLLC